MPYFFSCQHTFNEDFQQDSASSDFSLSDKEYKMCMDEEVEYYVAFFSTRKEGRAELNIPELVKGSEKAEEYDEYDIYDLRQLIKEYSEQSDNE
jgi:hypothetical protein